MLDPYASCPCGSGKKFKWCCQAVYPAIQQAVQQDARGQHENALRAIDQLTKEHPGNPEVWGQQARLLFNNGKHDQAEQALEKAFAINPDYPFGLLLRASMRHAEGELEGAVLLARRASEAYDPQAHDMLAQVYYLIFDSELRLMRPVAARAALEQVAHLQPGSEEVRETLDKVFGPDSRMPASARMKYDLKKALPARRESWNRTLSSSGARLADLAQGFETLTTADASDAPAWFNLALVRAWLGDNRKAVPALDRYIELETDEQAAVEAVTLGEVLRVGHGLEEDSDYCMRVVMVAFRNTEPVNRLLNEWNQAGRLAPLQTQQENVFEALILETSPTGLVTVGRPASEIARLGGYLLIVGNLFRLSGPAKEPFERLREEVRQKLALGLTDLEVRRGPLPFHEVVAEALTFPLAQTDQEKAVALVAENAGRFYEDTWIHQQRRSLDGNAPVDAAGSPRLRKKLRGVIQFIEECAQGTMVGAYPFDHLRRKLGLSDLAAAAPAASGAQPAGPAVDISALGAAELAALKPESLSDEQLEQAYQAAHRLDAQELAGHFAGALVARPVQPDRPDRYPWYSFLTQKAVRDGQLDAALDYVNEGERADCEHNGGKRRNDYELRRAHVHAKRGEVEQSQSVFQGLIERTPRNFEVRGQAAKTMLDLKQPAAALKFAEDGITAARQANNRDAEQMLLELAHAARRATGS
jgi:tetratricopeptide (TPR) repeat protein